MPHPQSRCRNFAKAGEKGVELEVVLELKLLADVGLVGWPECRQVHTVGSYYGSKPGDCKLSFYNTQSYSWV